MNLPDLKKLKDIINLCRKTGVQSIEIDGVKIVMGEERARNPSPSKQAPGAASYLDQASVFESDSPSDEDLLLWSVPASVTDAEPKDGQ